MTSDVQQSTRLRLLDSAVGLFAAQGYAATSVRQICDRAGANLASVNYHFGSKQRLYDEAFDFARSESNVRNAWVATDTARDFWAGMPAQERLNRFISMMLDHALDRHGDASNLSRMMIHEMLDPTPAFDRQVKLSIGRVFEALCEICRDIAGRDVDDEAIARVALLVSAQCLYQSLAARVLPQLHPGIRFDRDGRATLAATIAKTTTEALVALRHGTEGSRTT